VNINIFFTAIIAGLIAILFLFKPIQLKKQDFGEIALLKLEKFTITELSDQGLSSVLRGTTGTRYKNRYVINNLDYIDNEDKFTVNLKAKVGNYKNNILDLTGDVEYIRADGLSFASQRAIYNEKSKIVKSPVKYTSRMNNHIAKGSSIEYNSISKITKSKNITINYKLKERK